MSLAAQTQGCQVLSAIRRVLVLVVDVRELAVKVRVGLRLAVVGDRANVGDGNVARVGIAAIIVASALVQDLNHVVGGGSRGSAQAHALGLSSNDERAVAVRSRRKALAHGTFRHVHPTRAAGRVFAIQLGIYNALLSSVQRQLVEEWGVCQRQARGIGLRSVNEEDLRVQTG